MIELNKKELKEISGGVSVWAIIGGIALVVFGIGVIDGVVRPLKCR